MNWIVSKKESTDKRGRTNYQDNFFFSSLDAALAYLAEKKLRESTIDSLADLRVKLVEIQKDLQKRVRLSVGKAPETA